MSCIAAEHAEPLVVGSGVEAGIDLLAGLWTVWYERHIGLVAVEGMLSMGGDLVELDPVEVLHEGGTFT